MRCCQFIVLWVLLLAAAGCARHPNRLRGTPAVEASMPLDTDFAVFDNSVRVRLERAVVERRFRSEQVCKIQATNYFRRVLGQAGTPDSIAGAPLTYSFRKKRNFGDREKEIRFVAGKRADEDVDYFEIKPSVAVPTNETNRLDLLAAIAALGVSVQEGPKLDSLSINGKRAWRVLVLNARTVTSPDKKLMLPAGTLGLIINPPYPP